MENKKEKKHPDLKHDKLHHRVIKPYLVLRYLLEKSDTETPIKADDIAEYLTAHYKIPTERRSVYRDIKAINQAFIMLENFCDIEEATKILEEDEYDEEKLILKNKKGFYVRNKYDINDIHRLAECVYSAKFLDESQSAALVDIVCAHVSEKQAEKIRHDVLLMNREKTNNSEVINSIATINEAMSKEINGKKHIPQKISFKYLKYTISNTKKQVERRRGDAYIVSPYALVINDGNYYLLAFDDKSKKFVHYRVDRMKEVNRIGEKRDGEDEFVKIDLKSYTRKLFSMYAGKEERVTLQFINPLLDTAIDRFGTEDARYSMSDDRHFTVTTRLEVSDQFFGWLLGFGKKVKILFPKEIREQFAAYLDGVREMY